MTMVILVMIEIGFKDRRKRKSMHLKNVITIDSVGFFCEWVCFMSWPVGCRRPDNSTHSSVIEDFMFFHKNIAKQTNQKESVLFVFVRSAIHNKHCRDQLPTIDFSWHFTFRDFQYCNCSPLLMNRFELCVETFVKLDFSFFFFGSETAIFCLDFRLDRVHQKPHTHSGRIGNLP